MVKLLNMNDDVTTENPSSAQIVASVDDLLIEIIQRLPLKSLVQLRLVSKYWNSLILDPKFSLLRNRPVVGHIFEGYDTGHATTWYTLFLDKSIRKMTPSKDPWHRHCIILHSCNGLLLCVSNKVSRKCYVCNPTTGKYIALPEVVIDHNTMMVRGMFLAFDPSKSPHYKVVCVLRENLRPIREHLHMFEVYSSETGLWTKGSELFEVNADFYYEDGVYWNGAIHWINVCNRNRDSVYFNLECDKKSLKVFLKPPLQAEINYVRNDYYFGESCDHLHFVDAYRAPDEFYVYEMKRDYSEWFVKYKVCVPEMKRDYSEWFFNSKGYLPGTKRNYCERLVKYRALVRLISRRYFVVRVKNDEDSFLVVADSDRIVRYNFVQKTCETLFDFESMGRYRSIFWGSRSLFQYIESICSV